MANPVSSAGGYSVPLFAYRAPGKFQGMFPKKRKTNLLNISELLLPSQASTVKAEKLWKSLSLTSIVSLNDQFSRTSKGMICCYGLNAEDYTGSCIAVVALVGYWVGPDPEDGWGYVEASLYKTY